MEVLFIGLGLMFAFIGFGLMIYIMIKAGTDQKLW